MRRSLLLPVAAVLLAACAGSEPGDDDFHEVAAVTGKSRHEVFQTLIDVVTEQGYTVRESDAALGRLATDWRTELLPFAGVTAASQGWRERLYARLHSGLGNFHAVSMAVQRQYNRAVDRPIDPQAAVWGPTEAQPTIAETLGQHLMYRLGEFGDEGLGQFSERGRQHFLDTWRPAETPDGP